MRSVIEIERDIEVTKTRLNLLRQEKRAAEKVAEIDAKFEALDRDGKEKS